MQRQGTEEEKAELHLVNLRIATAHTRPIARLFSPTQRETVMKHLVLTVTILLSSVVSAHAQLTPEEMNIVQNMFGTEKRSLIVQSITLTPSDSVGFWPLYNKYEADRKEVGKKRIDLITRFVNKYPAISNEELATLMDAIIGMENEQQELMRTYFGAIKKASSVSVAAQWYQLESYITSAIRLSIQEKLPFVGVMKKH